MEAVVKTGQTEAQGNTVLTAKSLTSSSGEEVLILLQIHSDPTTAKGLQKGCLDIIKQSLLATEGDPGERLDGTLKELNGLIKGLLLSKTVTDLHALIAIADADGQLNVSHAGRAEAYVVRGGSASQITEYSRGKPSPVFVHIASGQLEPKDVVILSTQRLLRTLTPAQLAKLAIKHDSLLHELKGALEAEKEETALALLLADPHADAAGAAPKAALPQRSRRGRRRSSSLWGQVLAAGSGILERIPSQPKKAPAKRKSTSKQASNISQNFQGFLQKFQKDLQDPNRKHKAHLLVVAGAFAVFLVIWMFVNLTALSQNSQTKAELQELITQATDDLRTAEHKRLMGDMDSANAILRRAEQSARQVMSNEAGHYRNEALELASRIRSKREEISNIIRLSPRVVVDLSAKKSSVKAQGFIGLDDEAFIAYDRQDLYSIIHNSSDDPQRLSEEELILQGTAFPRYQTTVFQTTGNTLLEIISGQASSMKTDDPAGWISGKDMETYLRFLYILSPENNQIYKYERLSNRYTAPSQYNINGEIEDALDITIDSNIFVLKKGGGIVKLLRGEAQPFSIRHLPEGSLDDATKIYKAPDGNLYFLDPVASRVIIVTDGGAGGESSYVKQYVLDSDEVGELRDLYVDDDESRLYVLDEKRIYKIDLGPSGQ